MPPERCGSCIGCRLARDPRFAESPCSRSPDGRSAATAGGEARPNPKVSPDQGFRRPLECVDLGPVVGRANCNCRRKDSRTCAAGFGTVSQSTNCDICPQYRPRYPDCDAGVALGFFEQPSLCELQIRLIRLHNGPETPILVCDDHSRGELGERTREVCERLGVELVHSGPKRIGHAGGDLGAFYHGVRWAKRLGLRTLVKLSQRFCVDRPGWLAEADELLHSGTLSLLSDACREARHSHPLRTEACVLRVDAWHREDVLVRIRPRRISPLPAERLVYNAIRYTGSPKFGRWPLLGGVDRCRKVPGICWHTANPEADYHTLAARLGVTLTSEFFSGPHPKDTPADFG